MPKAVATQDTTRVDLKSCPGGFVELRKLSYGEILKRREISSEATAPLGQKNSDTPTEMRLHIAILKTQQYDFSKCIIDHNLEDENDRKLNLASPSDFQKLDPKVAQEIEYYIDQLNQPEDLTPLATTSGEPSPQGDGLVESAPKPSSPSK